MMINFNYLFKSLGSLAKLSKGFQAAGDNITSLSVIPTAVPELSRVTIVCSLSQENVLQLKRRLQRLVSVSFLHITNMDSNIDGNLIERMHALIKIKTPEFLPELTDFVDTISGELLSTDDDTAASTQLIHVVANQREMDALLTTIQQRYSIIEVQQSSPVFVEKLQPTLNPYQNSHLIQYKDLTTQQIHTNVYGKYTKERLLLHARIAHQLYSGVPENVNRPKFILLLGIPGSGKTTILRELDTKFNLVEFVNFDVDECLANLPEFYHAMLNIGLGLVEKKKYPTPHMRYRMCQEEARFIIKKNREVAIMQRKNIIFHGSGRSYNEYAAILRQVKAAGYQVHLVGVDVPVETAYERVRKRSGRYGRDVPAEVIDSSASSITRNYPRLVKQVDFAHLFDSSIRPPKLIWSKQKSRIVKSDVDHPTQQKYNLPPSS